MDPAANRSRGTLSESIVHVFGGLAVADLAPALSWYERLLGRPPDMRPHAQEATWQLTATASIYVVLDPARAGRGLLTVIINDLDGFLTGPVGRGLMSDNRQGTAAEIRRAVFTDLDGNRLTFAELPPRPPSP
ncbi:MAG TPA: VOC family protein [Candidatus Dormibacteraeota bacterium]|nr:VOC family protein [Candidatus Dormibacteraeota bacterium]